MIQAKIRPNLKRPHLNQNLVIAIIGAVATVMAAVIPWVLDRILTSIPAVQLPFRQPLQSMPLLEITGSAEATATQY